MRDSEVISQGVYYYYDCLFELSRMPAPCVVWGDLNGRRGAFGRFVEYEACQQEACGEEVDTETMKKAMGTLVSLNLTDSI